MRMKRFVKRVVWDNLIGSIRDGLAMQRIQPLIAEGSYIPWSDSALSATAISTVLNDIVVNSRSTIVECGGGVSTIYVGSLLRQIDRIDAHLYTIEHDEEWIEILEEMIKDHRIDEWVTVVHAPLSHTPISWSGERWYDTSVLESMLRDIRIDLLLVDGPPAHEEEIKYARYPAVPFFEETLADSYSIIIDDINRSSEYNITRKWEEILEVNFEDRIMSGDISVAISGESHNV